MIKLFSLREKCPNALKYGLEKIPCLDTFHAVFAFSELILKSFCVMCFICLKNIDAGAFFRKKISIRA